VAASLNTFSLYKHAALHYVPAVATTGCYDQQYFHKAFTDGPIPHMPLHSFSTQSYLKHSLDNLRLNHHLNVFCFMKMMSNPSQNN
jgi:hypothetical protein